MSLKSNFTEELIQYLIALDSDELSLQIEESHRFVFILNVTTCVTLWKFICDILGCC